jgi:autotransporter passenger strand-loop-strand repeat protein
MTSFISLSSGGVSMPEENTVSGLVVSGGETLIVSSGGIASNIYVAPGGALSVLSGGTATGVGVTSGSTITYQTIAYVPVIVTSNYTDVINYYTIPTTGLVTITADGAGGGDAGVGGGGGASSLFNAITLYNDSYGSHTLRANINGGNANTTT